MDERNLRAAQFEEQRGQLRAVAYRMLGSLSEADDAVQEAWLRLNRTDVSDIENLDGWLRTVVARVCLDMLRARRSRREDSLDALVANPLVSRAGEADPEQEELLADSVGLALLVVLDTLTPAERLAFVLHDMFGVPFDEIGPLVERSPTAARQLASRARRRVRGASQVRGADHSRQRALVDAFLAAARGGDFEALLAVLDPEVVLRTDRFVGAAGSPTARRGAEAVARGAAVDGARVAQPALINGAVGLVVAPRGRLLMVLLFTIDDGKIVEIEGIGDPERLAQLDLAILAD